MFNVQCYKMKNVRFLLKVQSETGKTRGKPVPATWRKSKPELKTVNK